MVELNPALPFSTGCRRVTLVQTPEHLVVELLESGELLDLSGD